MTKQNLRSRLVRKMTLVVETMLLPPTVFVVAVAAVVAVAFFVWDLQQCKWNYFQP